MPTRYLSVTQQQEMDLKGSWGYERNLKNVLLFPWNLTMGIFEHVTFDQSPGPFYIALVPLLVFLRRPPFVVKTCLVSTLAGLPFFLLFVPKPRYVMPFLALSCMIVGYVAVRLISQAKVLRWTLRPLMGASFLLFIGIFSGKAAVRANVAFGLESRDAFLERMDTMYPVAKYVNEHVRPGKTLVIADRSYYFDVPYIVAHPDRQSVVEYRSFVDECDMLRRFRELGVNQVVLNRPLMESRAPYILPLFDTLVPGALRLVYERKGIGVYSISDVA